MTLKPARFVTSISLALFCFTAMSARAATTYTTFGATGTFDDGSTLSGTIMIDTVNGDLGAIDLFVSAPDNLTLDYNLESESSSGDYLIYVGESSNEFPEFVLSLPVDSLVGYTGGVIDSDDDPGPGVLSSPLYLTLEDVVTLQSGSLTPTPEPASWILAFTSLAMIAAMRLRRASS